MISTEAPRIQDLLDLASTLNGHSDSPHLDCQLIICHDMGVTRSYLYAHGDQRISDQCYARITALLERRRKGEPVAYIIGKQEFWSLEFNVTPAVLIPRPETELLVEVALGHAGNAVTVLELGTGSGAIAVAIKSERRSMHVTATDISQAALEIAQSNAALHGADIEWLTGDWFAPVAGRYFDLIVSNPPYIRQGDPLDLASRGLEPRGALIAENMGRADLCLIIGQAHRHLTSGGTLILEHGYDQSQYVCDMLADEHFINITTHRDLAGINRAVSATRRAI